VDVARPASPEDPGLGAERSELRARVAAALEALPAAQKKVIELAFFGGLSHSEIAHELGEPLGTVKTRIRSAMEKLRGTLALHATAG
jgi:RNA polymerase sigma-70 factor (ECF subfamily)